MPRWVIRPTAPSSGHPARRSRGGEREGYGVGPEAVSGTPVRFARGLRVDGERQARVGVAKPSLSSP